MAESTAVLPGSSARASAISRSVVPCTRQLAISEHQPRRPAAAVTKSLPTQPHTKLPFTYLMPDWNRRRVYTAIARSVQKGDILSGFTGIIEGDRIGEWMRDLIGTVGEARCHRSVGVNQIVLVSAHEAGLRVLEERRPEAPGGLI